MFNSHVSSHFCHQAFPYEGMEDFVAGVYAYVAEGVERGEAILVIADAAKLALLDTRLDSSWPVEKVRIDALGGNPARMTSLWLDFAASARAGGGSFRGVGEPLSAPCGEDALSEYHKQESLLNAAFLGSPRWNLLCAYDTSTLSGPVVQQALAAHPLLFGNGRTEQNPGFCPQSEQEILATYPLEEVPGPPIEASVYSGSLPSLRGLLRDQASRNPSSPMRHAL